MTMRTTTPRPIDAAVLPNHGEVTLPEPGPGQLEDLACFRPAHEVLERALDRAGVRPLAAQPGCFLQQVRTKHKICACHVHRV